MHETNSDTGLQLEPTHEQIAKIEATLKAAHMLT